MVVYRDTIQVCHWWYLGMCQCHQTGLFENHTDQRVQHVMDTFERTYAKQCGLINENEKHAKNCCHFQINPRWSANLLNKKESRNDYIPQSSNVYTFSLKKCQVDVTIIALARWGGKNSESCSRIIVSTPMTRDAQLVGPRIEKHFCSFSVTSSWIGTVLTGSMACS